MYPFLQLVPISMLLGGAWREQGGNAVKVSSLLAQGQNFYTSGGGRQMSLCRQSSLLWCFYTNATQEKADSPKSLKCH